MDAIAHTHPMITKNIGMLLLAIYLIVVGLVTLTGLGVGISNAERDIARAEQIKNCVIEPRLVTEFERGAHRGKLAQECAQHVFIFFERGRQLKQHWPKSFAESSHHFAEVLERVRAIAQF